MTKSRLFMLVGVLLLSLTMVGISLAADTPQTPPPPVAFTGTPEQQSKDGSTPDSISGSFAVFDGGEYGDFCSSGGTDYLCFNYHVQTTDWNYPWGLRMKLPDGWTGLSGYLYDYTCSGTGYPSTLTFEGGNEVFFNQFWYVGTVEACDAVYCMDVTTGGPASIPWFIDSDYYGGSPFNTCDNSGYYSCEEAVMPPADVPSCEPGIYLSPESQSGDACEDSVVDYNLSLYNNSGEDDTFDLSYDSMWPISGPSDIYVADGTAEGFVVSVTVPCGGDEDTATVYVEGGGYSDSSTLTTSVSTDGGWAAVPASAPAWAGVGYPRDGCTAMNAAGEWVTYEFGDTTSFFGFWGYNMDTNLWFQVGAANTPADRWAPDWAYDPDTNLCYVTGGASAPGGGTYNTAYVFDPVANSFTQLGNFTSIRDFHNSWVGTIDGTKYLCIGGGTNSSSILVQSTQCYDLAQAAPGTWNAENAQMAAFPTDPFGAADGILHAPSGDQFWYVGGAINAFATVTDEARYWDDADNAWHFAGNTGFPRYRVEGDFFNGMFYQLGGSTGGFTPTSEVVAGEYDGAVWVWTQQESLANIRMDNVVGVADTVWSLDGYGANASDYVEYLQVCEECGPAGGILLVDDDQGDPDSSRLAYTNALDALGYTYDIWDTDLSGEPTSADLTPYSAVIWYTAHTFYAGPHPGAGEDALAEWLGGEAPPVQPMSSPFANSMDVPEGYVPTLTISENKGVSAGMVGLFKDDNPWGSLAWEIEMASNGISYEVHSSSEFASLDFSQFGMIIVACSQSDAFYANYAANMTKFEDYVEAGGFLNFCAATQGASLTLPGGMLATYNGESYNVIDDLAHPLVAGVPNPFFGNWASHNIFSNLPAGSYIIAHGQSSGEPTLVEYGMGAGWFVGFGQTLEITWDLGWEGWPIVPNAIMYGYNWGGGNVIKDRCFLLSAQDYLYENGLTPFGEEYLGIESFSNDVHQTVVTGAGSVYSGLGPYTLVYPFGDWADVVNPDGTAEVAFDGTSGNAAIDKFGETWFTTFAAYPLEAIADLGDRADVISTFLSTCGFVPPEDPDIEVTPTELSSIQPPDTTADETLNIANLGEGDLIWSIDEENTSFGAPVANALLANTDVAPVSRAPISPLALGDWLFDIEAELATGNNLLLGVEFAQDHYWVTGGEPAGGTGLLYKLDTAGSLVATYAQAGPCTGWGGRDLTWDGTYLYYSCDDGLIYQVDPATGAPTGVTIPGPNFPNRALAYDPATDHFWTANWDSNLFEIDRSGMIINAFPPVGLSTYGMAWDTWSPGGPFLWLWSQDGGDPALLATQVNPLTGVPTGVSFLGTGFSGEMAGGATITDQILPGQPVFVGMTQGVTDRIGVYDMAVVAEDCASPSDIPWLSEVPTSGTTPGGGSTDVTVTFDSNGLAQGTYTGNLCVNSNDPDEPLVVVPVTLDVVGAPDITVEPMDLGSVLPPDATETQTLEVCNVGDATLDWALSEVPGTKLFGALPVTVPVPPRQVALALDANGVSGPTASAPSVPEDAVALVLDDGSRENDIGIGGTLEFIWLNRFTPDPADFPFDLNQVQIYFSSVGLVNVGDDIIIVVYENTTGSWDPAPGSNWLASFPTTVQSVDAWNVYDLATAVTLNGPGDVLVGVIGLEVPGTSYWPASMDQTATQNRSWAGWWVASPPPTPPILPPDADWTNIDAYFPGNWMVRGYGETTMADILWLSEDPLAGSLEPGECETVDVTFDSTGLALGTYTGDLVFDSNDPDGPVTVPVTLIVEEAEPEIVVTAPPLDMMLMPGEMGMIDFTIENIGNADLIWSIATGEDWLSASPASGTLPAGEMVTVTVTFDAAGMMPGDYMDDLVITSNDVDEPTTTLPATLTVENFTFYLPFLHK
jgi:hypothetical protein